MRKRLFVDCDDTLIIYDAGGDAPHPYGFSRGEPYHINWPLAESIAAFRHDNPCALVVIWSGGGEAYARTIANRFLPGLDVACMSKGQPTFNLVRAGDIVVDDMDLNVPAKVLQPDEWVYPIEGVV